MRRVLLVVLMVVLGLALVACGSSDNPGDVGSPPDDASDALSTTAGGQGPDNTPDRVDGVVRVVLGWDEPIDMDLEIWDSLGETAITAAGLEGVDVVSGDDGREFFDFTEDFASGRYVVSIYFAEEENIVDAATATLTVLKADGSTEIRSRSIAWEEGSDQWHAFEIDGATGDIVDVNRVIQIEVTE